MAKDAEGKEIIENKGEEKLLPQSQVDAIVQDRLARERSKFADYDDLKKFKSEFEKSQDAKQLQLLEEQKKYQEAKDSYEKKIGEFQGIVTKKDSEISDMKIGNSLITEITKQNAYAEEAMALLRSQAVFDKEGNIRIKGRDANGLEVLNSVEEGVKKFLEGRPHLIKATKKEGGGTGGGQGTAAGAGAGAEDLDTLNAELIEAQRAQDYKKAGEITKKIRAKLTAQGVRL